MLSQLHKNAAIVLFLFLRLTCLGQEEIIEDLRVVDTSTYNGQTIFIFNDKSWEYESDYHSNYKIEVVFKDGIPLFDSLKITNYNWSSTKTFSNKFNLRALEDTIALKVSGFVSPINVKMNSSFKIRNGRWHKGEDYACNIGTPIKSCYSGVVRYARMNYGGYGNLVIIRHFNGIETYYAHLSNIRVQPNQKVKAGEIIGLSGNTGHSTGPHLHFECRVLDNPFNPKLLRNSKGTLLLTSKDFIHNKRSNDSFKFRELISQEKEVLTRKKIPGRRTSGNL